MKIRNSEKILMKFLDRYSKIRSKRIYATPKEIKAYEGLKKYKHNKVILNLIHLYVDRISKKKNLSV